jgi:hypothetical protein
LRGETVGDGLSLRAPRKDLDGHTSHLRKVRSDPRDEREHVILLGRQGPHDLTDVDGGSLCATERDAGIGR